ncbi:hypothetical protein EDD92_4960 [Streptomyces sp. TLI_185]|nr:hypothetical protein EDD92_4960 [Streptomyces sp. TLI_185]
MRVGDSARPRASVLTQAHHDYTRLTRALSEIDKALGDEDA